MFKLKKRLRKNEAENLKKLDDLEEGDVKAIIIAGLTTFMPVVILVLALFYFIIWILFLR
ncbi:MAG: hypothetical protein GX038_00415 [Erysipelothrix sp.]|nr:hypothetical protein [Erysipelothrix sp.]